MIIVLVEGIGDKRSLPVIVQRALLKKISVKCVDMQGKSNIVRREHGFEDTVRRQHFQGGRSFVVLLDGDVPFAPYRSLHEEQEDMPRRAAALEKELGVPVQVLWAVREMESWLIGGIKPKDTFCGLKKGAKKIPANTELEPQDPKEWLQDRLDLDYMPQTQECLARHIDLQEARARNQSMRVFLASVP